MTQRSGQAEVPVGQDDGGQIVKNDIARSQFLDNRSSHDDLVSCGRVGGGLRSGGNDATTPGG